MLSTGVIEYTRLQALRFFKADPEHFDLIFVANATAAIKLVMDCLSDTAEEQHPGTAIMRVLTHPSLVSEKPPVDLLGVSSLTKTSP